MHESVSESKEEAGGEGEEWAEWEHDWGGSSAPEARTSRGSQNSGGGGTTTTTKKERPRREYATVAICGLVVFMLGGVVFGFSSLYPVLYKEQVFQDQCSAKDREECDDESSCCSGQRLWLTAVASCSLFAADGIMVLYGEANDRLGPVWCLGIGGGLVFAGMQLVAISSSLDVAKNELFFVALMAMGLGGPGIFMGCLGFGTADPEIEPAVTAVTAACWDSSSVVFLLFAYAYSSGSDFAAVVGAWGIAGLILVVAAARRLRTKLRKGSPVAVSTDAPLRAPLLADVATGDGLSPPLWELLTRGDTTRLVAFMAVYNLKSAFYIESVSDQIRASLGVSDRAARRLDLTFNLAFPIGGFATSLASTHVLERYRGRDDVIFLLVAVLANLFSLVQLVPHPAAQYAAALLFGPARTLQWAAYFHFLMSRYPGDAGGRLIGYGNLVIAVVGDGIPYALNAYVASSHSGPLSVAAKYLAVHALLALAILIASLITYLHFARHLVLHTPSSFLIPPPPSSSFQAAAENNLPAALGGPSLATPPGLLSSSSPPQSTVDLTP